MPDWIITYNEEELLPADDVPTYFYIADDREHKKRGELFLHNPPPVTKVKRWREYMTYYRKLSGRFGCGTLIRATQLREFLDINKSKLTFVMRYLCNTGYANRYVAGVMWPEKDSHERRPYGIHYMMLKKELPKEYYE